MTSVYLGGYCQKPLIKKVGSKDTRRCSQVGRCMLPHCGQAQISGGAHNGPGEILCGGVWLVGQKGKWGRAPLVGNPTRKKRRQCGDRYCIPDSRFVKVDTCGV
jgi:hypothetical protein